MAATCAHHSYRRLLALGQMGMDSTTGGVGHAIIGPGISCDLNAVASERCDRCFEFPTSEKMDTALEKLAEGAAPNAQLYTPHDRTRAINHRVFAC